MKVRRYRIKDEFTKSALSLLVFILNRFIDFKIPFEGRVIVGLVGGRKFAVLVGAYRLRNRVGFLRVRIVIAGVQGSG